MDLYTLNPHSVVTWRKWTDYTTGEVLVTLPISQAVIVVAATTLFITYVGSCFWAITQFVVHQVLASDKRPDGLKLVLRVLYRNVGSAPKAILDLVQIWWSWRKANPKVSRRTIRVVWCILPPIFNVIAFAAAGIFSSYVAGKGYRSNRVLVKPENCGADDPLYWNITSTNGAQGEIQLLQTYQNSTQAARQYATSCYRSTSKDGPCSLFPTRTIQYDFDTVSCPFGLDDAGNSLCAPYDNQAIRLATPLLDVNTIFGVNVPAAYRIGVAKSLTCAPVNVTQYTHMDYEGYENATTYLELGSVAGFASYTWSYKQRSKNDSFGYQLFSLTPSVLWSPVDSLKVAHGDVSVVILTPNSLHYLNRVKDPWFSANRYTSVIEPAAAYQSDQEISVMGCVEQFQICNPNTSPDSTCTVLGSIADLFNAAPEIGLNKYQKVMATRFYFLWQTTSIWNSINLQGAGTLLASQNIFGLECPSLPDDQWQSEVRFWFETSLSAMQAAVVKFVKNPDQTSLDPNARVTPPFPGTPQEYFCHVQRVRNTGAFISFLLFGVLAIYIPGAVIIIVSFLLEPGLSCMRRGKFTPRDIVRIADGRTQLLRKLVESTAPDEERWENAMGDHPYTQGNRIFTRPERWVHLGVTDYTPTRLADVELVELNAEAEQNNVAAEMVTEQAEAKADNDPVVTAEEQCETQSLLNQDHDRASRRSASSLSAISNVTNPREN